MKKFIYSLAVAAMMTACSSNSRECPEGAITVDVDGEEIVMIQIPAGDFTMGGTSEQVDCDYFSEKPAHKVVLTKPYYISQTEVTREL